MHPNRRQMLARSAGVAGLLAGLGLLPEAAQAAWPTAAFDARSVADALKALGLSAPVDSREVTLSAPDIAENGAVVPVGCACALPGVKRLLVLVDKNPSSLSAVFEPGEALEAAVSTRVKMAQTATVLAVAVMADNRVLFTQKEVKVTLGGCGG